MPKVTIAIPFFDEAAVLPDAIRSVFAQTFSDWELLLVDDGSTDRSREIAESVRDPRVRVISDGDRRRLPARLNQVVREARGELVARMDADDLMHPTRLAREIEVLDAQPEVDAVGTFIAYWFGDGQPTIGETKAPSHPREVLLRGGIAHATMVSRRTFSERYPYDEALDRAEDRDLYCRTYGIAKFIALPEPLYVVRPRIFEPSFVANYARSTRQNRALYMRYGARLVGIPETARAIAGSLAREAVYRAASRVGVTEQLVRRRGRPASASELRLVLETFRAVDDALVPGLTARTSARAP